jgi:MFS transporter, FHS family, L-fucose permease
MNKKGKTFNISKCFLFSLLKIACIMSEKTKWSQFGVLISVFFFWGFVAASNDILIPVFKDKLHLTQVQAQMVSFAFYVAYTVGSLLYFLISRAIKQDLLNKIGFKNGIAVGLCVSALGTLLFIPAASSESFFLFISGLFIVGLGFSLQQTAANPLAINMGSPSTGAQRLSMAGGVNNFGTTIGPLIVNLAIFGSVTSVATSASLSDVKVPYVVLGLAFLIVAAIFYFSKVPNKLQVHEEAASAAGFQDRGSAFKYPQLTLGMIAIFVYVGVEVSTASNLPEFMKQNLGIETNKISPYISLFWASLMIGRWTAASGAFGFSKQAQNVMKVVMPYLAFGVFLFVNWLMKTDVQPFFVYGLAITALIAANFYANGDPAKELFTFSIMGIIATLIGIFAKDGMVSTFAFCSVGLFCSTLWPCIFTLAITGLGKHTSNGSNALISMIMGGGVISVLQGFLADDKYLGIRMSYIVGICCFAYLAYYAIKANAELRKQGIQTNPATSKGVGH